MAAGSLNVTLKQFKENQSLRLKILSQMQIIPQLPPMLTRTAPGWGRLHPDVLQKVYQKLDEDFVIKHCTLVNKHWRRAVMNDKFIKSLTISGSEEETPLYLIFNFLRMYRKLVQLTLINVPNIWEILLQASKMCKNLKRIALKNYACINGQILIYIRIAFPHLEGIDLESSYVDIQNFSREIKLLTDLKLINLFNVKTVNLSTGTILEIVLNCHNIEELHVGLLPPLINLTDDDVAMILTHLSNKLKVLTLDARHLTLRSFEKLKECTLLESLAIKFAVNLTGEFLENLWMHLWHINKLAFTHNCIITGKNLQVMLRYGEDVFKHVTYLDFTYCVHLSDAGISAIAHQCPDLQKIILKSCRSVLSIKDLCTRCTALRVIDISYCHRLRLNFDLPKLLDMLVIDESNNMTNFAEKFIQIKHLRIYISISEFNDILKRL